MPEGWDVAAQTPSVFPQIINPSGTTRLRPDPPDVLVPRCAERPGRGARPDRGGRAVRPRRRSRRPRSSTGHGDVHLGDRGRPSASTSSTPTSRRPALWGAEFTHRRRRRRPRDDPARRSTCSRTSTVVAVGDPAPPSDTPTLADVGGDVTKISTDDEPVEAFYETSIADALAAEEPFVVVFATPKFCTTAAVRADARPGQADRRRASRRHLHQRRAVPARAGRRAAPAGPDRRAARPHRGPGDRRVAPAQRAVGLRRRRRRHRDRVVDADLQRRGARGGGRRGRLSRSAQPPASSSRTAYALVAFRPVPDADRLRPSPGARPGGPAGTRSRSRARRGRNSSVSPPATRSVNPRTSVRPAMSTPTITPSTAATSGRSVRVDGSCVSLEQERGPARDRDDHDQDQRRTGSACGDPRQASGAGRGPGARPGAARGVDRRRPRRNAGRSPRPARRSAGRAATASGADRRARWSVR